MDCHSYHNWHIVVSIRTVVEVLSLCCRCSFPRPPTSTKFWNHPFFCHHQYYQYRPSIIRSDLFGSLSPIDTNTRRVILWVSTTTWFIRTLPVSSLSELLMLSHIVSSTLRTYRTAILHADVIHHLRRGHHHHHHHQHNQYHHYHRDYCFSSIIYYCLSCFLNFLFLLPTFRLLDGLDTTHRIVTPNGPSLEFRSVLHYCCCCCCCRR